jgi:hypothetical protein
MNFRTLIGKFDSKLAPVGLRRNLQGAQQDTPFMFYHCMRYRSTIIGDFFEIFCPVINKMVV